MDQLKEIVGRLESIDSRRAKLGFTAEQKKVLEDALDRWSTRDVRFLIGLLKRKAVEALANK